MARRRRRSGIPVTWYAAAIALLFVVWLVSVALAYWYFTLLVVALAGGAWYWRRKEKRRAVERVEREEEERWEANRQAWRELTFDAGPYSVIVSGFVDITGQEDVTDFLCDIPVLRDETVEYVEALIQRIVHIAPQVVVSGVAQRNAIRVKEALELRGAKVKIKEETTRDLANGRREPITAAVRREVWNRDGGRCVDCGSRERLEYDHIIAIANGGSNTARNLELRCESCNRKKGAKV